MDKNLYTISTERCKHFELGKAEWMKDIQTAAIQSPLPPHPTHLTSPLLPLPQRQHYIKLRAE